MTRLIVSAGALARRGTWIDCVGAGRIVLVSEPRAFERRGRAAAVALRKVSGAPLVHLLPGGERAKEWAAVERLLCAMARSGCDRRTVVVAVGGGALTDAAGFAASLFMRGVPWISAPTTLLGQVDAGLGGKTAINLKEGKNLAGAFHRPLAVVCDMEALSTLSRRDLVSGLAEALKCGLVFDPPLWDWLRRSWDGLAAGEPAALERVVKAAAGWKLRVVASDERETSGCRELLNFGHTLGHALEHACGYGRLRHGEAVLWGMRAAALLSEALAGLPAGRAEEIEEFLAAAAALPLRGIRPGAILAAARRDKKARAGQMRFILLRDVGRPVAGVEVGKAAAAGAVAALLRER